MASSNEAGKVIVHLNVNRFFKYLTIFVLFFGIGFYSESAQFQCKDLFQNETHSSTATDANDRTPGLSKAASFHILQGEFSGDGKLEAGMHTIDGLFKLFELNKHLVIDESSRTTPFALRELVAIAQAIYPRDSSLVFENALLTTHENGVIFAQLPQSVLSRRVQEVNREVGLKFPGNYYVKSLFPVSWTHDFIISTVKEIASTADHRERYVRKSMRRTIDGVTVVVRFEDDGKIGSAYPAFDQPKYENKNFAAFQIDAIEKYFLVPFAEMVEKSKFFWLIGNAEAIKEGREIGFVKSPKVRAVLEENLGMNVFRNRLFAERKQLPSNQFKQKSRALLVNFGITAPTLADIDNVHQILLDNTVMFSQSLQQKLNTAARKSLQLYFRPESEGISLADIFARDAEKNWYSIFFTDVSRQ